MSSTMPVAANLYDWLLFFHILAAMIWVGGLVALTVFGGSVVRSGDPAAVARFVRTLPVVGPMVLAPAVVVLFAVGIWLVLDSDAWDFGQTWVQVGVALFAVAFVVGAAFQSRSALAAQRAADAGDDAEAARQLGRWSWGMRVILLLLLAATWDMVFKPGL